MKKYKTLLIVTIILAIVAVSAISFFGLYMKKEFTTVNLIPDYILGMEFKGGIMLTLDVDTSVKSTNIYDKDGNLVENPDPNTDYTAADGYTTVDEMANNSDVLNEQNYDKAKNILINRLKQTGAKQYDIREDKGTGKISINIPNDNNANQIIGVLAETGKVEVQDNDTKAVLLSNQDIAKANVVYGTAQDGTSTNVYLQLQMTKDAAKKLSDMSNKYTGSTNAANSTDDSTSSPTNEITVLYDDNTLATTYFGGAVTDGNLNVYIGNGTTSQDINGYMQQAKGLAIGINTGKMPVAYTPSANDLTPTINTKTVMNCIYGVIAFLVLLNIFLIIKFRLNGVYSLILQAGYIAVLLLIIRETNVLITIEGIARNSNCCVN